MSQPLDKSNAGENQKNFLQTDHLKADLKQRSVRGGFITTIAQCCKFVLMLGSNLALARLLTPEAYGLIGMVTAVTGFVALFKDLGLSMATIQQEELTQQQVSNLFWINCVVSFMSTLITIAIASAIAQFYHEPRLIWITIALSTGFMIGGLGVQHAALLTRQMHYKALMISDVSSQFFGIAVAIILALYGFGYWALVALPLITASTNTLGVWLSCSWRPNLPTKESGMKSLLAFGGNIAGFGIVDYFALNLDNILIGKFWGAQQLGLYAKAYQLLLLPISQINAPLTNVVVPLLSRLTDSPERYREVYLRSLETIILITTPIIVFMVVTADLLIPLLLGSQWTEAVPLFILLGVSGIFRPVMSSTGWLFISQNRTSDLFKWGVISSITIVLSFLIGIPWGASGVATAYSATLIFVVLPTLFWFVGLRGPVKTRDFYFAIAPIILTGAWTSGLLLAYRKWMFLTSPEMDCVILFGITFFCFYATLFTFPQGRKILQNIKQITLVLKTKKTNYI